MTARDLLPLLLLALLLAAADARDDEWVRPRGDALHYTRMAREGVWSGERVAPYVYRPAWPALVGLGARLADVPVERAFRAGGLLSLALLGLATVGVGRRLGAGPGLQCLVLAALFSNPVLVRLPLFFPTLIDVAAYPLMLLLVWQLLAGRTLAVALGSSVGALLKEFLVLPGAVALLLLARDALRRPGGGGGARAGLRLLLGGAPLLAAVLLPRLWIEVSYTLQPVDPILVPESLHPRHLARTLIDPPRWLNAGLGLVLQAAPLLLVLDAARTARIRGWLALGDRAACTALLLAGVTLLALLGGTNVSVFCSYSFPLWLVGLFVALGGGISRLEAALLLAALARVTRVLAAAPHPELDLEAYVDFFGPFGDRIAPALLLRTGELLALAGGLALLRRRGALPPSPSP